MTAAGKESDGGQQPDDAAALEHEIEQTREELGETVAALAAKTDVKARAASKARELTDRLTHRAGQAGGQAAGRAGAARSRTLLAGRSGQRQALPATGSQAGATRGKQVTARVTAVTGPAKQAGQRAVAAAGQSPVVPAAMLAGAAVLAIIAAVGWRRR